MGARHPNPRRVKIHRPYTVEQLAAVLKVHKNTIRRWAKEGLRPIDDGRPSMFRGADVVAFLSARRQAAKRQCGVGEIYCLPCRMPKSPAGLVADLYVKCLTVGWIAAICPTCHRMLYRRVNPTRIDLIRGNLEISIRQGQARLADRTDPIVNGDFEGAPRS
jgi:excisionase family DNA binding protein